MMQGGNAAFDMIKGFRLDDACGGPDTTTTCLHIDKASKYHGTKQITLTGDSTIYNVKIRFRGVTEPTIIGGASNPDPSHTQFAKGGSPSDRTYQTWYLGVSNPAATYYLNAFKSTGHVVYLVDYTETIPMAANAVLKLDIQDDNNHLILNGDTTGINDPSMPNATKKTVAFTDIPGSMANGQFIQLELISVTPQ
jgi:hypothetical protein